MPIEDGLHEGAFEQESADPAALVAHRLHANADPLADPELQPEADDGGLRRMVAVHAGLEDLVERRVIGTIASIDARLVHVSSSPSVGGISRSDTSNKT